MSQANAPVPTISASIIDMAGSPVGRLKLPSRMKMRIPVKTFFFAEAMRNHLRSRQAAGQIEIYFAILNIVLSLGGKHRNR